MALGVPVIICHLPQTLQDPQHLYIHTGPEPSTRNILLPHPAPFLGNLPFSQDSPHVSSALFSASNTLLLVPLGVNLTQQETGGQDCHYLSLQ